MSKMSRIIYSIEARLAQDIVRARQKTREMALFLGFDSQGQTRMATAVSEIARNALNYAGGGKVEFWVEGETSPQIFVIRIKDQGPGIPDLSSILKGTYIPMNGIGISTGILSARRLMNDFHIESVEGKGTTVRLMKKFPVKAPFLSEQDLVRIAGELMRQAPKTAMEEVQQQNQELLHLLDDLRKHQEEMIQLNNELENTNRGVLALYAELDEKAHQLQKANELKSRFISHMSHEFRTPLKSILTLSRILMDRTDGGLTSEQEKQVTFIHQSGENLLELANDLLDMAKIEAGKIIVQPIEFELNTLFSALRGIMRPLSVNPSVELVFENPLASALLHTDENKVSQILRNLISNALKFTEKGEVRVTARLDECDESVIFSVIDTGIGIESKEQESIFEEYIQLKTSLKKQFKGTGLGLPISKKMAQLLGGDLFLVKSQQGMGSEFSAVIPIIYGASPIRETPEISRKIYSKVNTLKRQAQKKKILIIDDDKISRYEFKKLLKDTPYILIEAASGKEGIQKAHEEKPHVIFLDLIMPGMNGFEVLNRLKSNFSTSDIPVIIFTAKNLNKEERSCLAEGAQAILSKMTATREEIIAQLKKIFNKIEELKGKDKI